MSSAPYGATIAKLSTSCRPRLKARHATATRLGVSKRSRKQASAARRVAPWNLLCNSKPRGGLPWRRRLPCCATPPPPSAASSQTISLWHGNRVGRRVANTSLSRFPSRAGRLNPYAAHAKRPPQLRPHSSRANSPWSGKNKKPRLSAPARFF